MCGAATICFYSLLKPMEEFYMYWLWMMHHLIFGLEKCNHDIIVIIVNVVEVLLSAGASDNRVLP